MLIQPQEAWGKVTGARQGGCEVGTGEQGPGRHTGSPSRPHLPGSQGHTLGDALGDVLLQVKVHLLP